MVSACLWRDSVENRSRSYDISPQTVRNYVEEQGIEVADRLLQEVQEVAREVLKGVEEVDVSVDWTGVKYWGERVEGLGSGDKGYQWNYATATTDYNGKTVILAFTRYNGMSKDEVVKILVEQVLSLGFWDNSAGRRLLHSRGHKVPLPV